eukprot:CAMPEP_0194281780 /NCGR_PEP_ID=MMETSP0169-20130528/21561_1 /TAXON_ID=218684 /ORGANISM="Corethron pennatum, Strain L29A3" /LENGTH=66 /DNA_ID=CAMNT_0039026935 /DNA_START=262 /DNA_END=462 /DNA_ORIENTATION=-
MKKSQQIQLAIDASRAEQRCRTNIAALKYNKRESEFELDEVFYFGSVDEEKEHETVNDLKASILKA